MISSDSRWDRAYAQVFNANAPNRNLGITLPGFTASEDLGRRLFMTGRNNGGAGCSACHVPPSFALAANSRSNGLDAGETVLFKAPSLKNIGRSQFFMHDGRFTTLAQVIDHYDNGIQNGPALDNRLRQGNQPQRLNLSQADKAGAGRLPQHADRHHAQQRPALQRTRSGSQATNSAGTQKARRSRRAAGLLMP